MNVMIPDGATDRGCAARLSSSETGDGVDLNGSSQEGSAAGLTED